jgi:hypothetical protein
MGEDQMFSYDIDEVLNVIEGYSRKNSLANGWVLSNKDMVHYSVFLHLFL